ncbi:Dynein heavy chain 8, axonemal [Desmophyllum pertusum]|uniref:Dynein heavy chain 8, axonemal n=1 Tax=Desmophyllum pertusum TaxID=174260 RepID=A0A9W9YBV3_9CNID|nr:Dynein heavy chain 8, axonemal [Desmophyllum pertusum]
MKCIDLLEGLIPSKEEHGVLSATHLSRLFVFALMWGVGALLEIEDRTKMEEFLMKHKKLSLPVIDPGSQDTIFEFVVDNSGNWEHWLNRLQEYIYPSDYKPEYSSILVPNVDNVRTNFLIETIAKQNKVRGFI